MSTLRIILQKPDLRKTGSFIEVARFTPVFDESVHFPFNRLIEDLKILYPIKNLVINFIILD